MKTGLLALALIPLLAACPRPPAPVVTETQCQAAQARLDALGCLMRETPKGAPFRDVCNHYAQLQPHPIDVGAVCIAQAENCEKAKRCK